MSDYTDAFQWFPCHYRPCDWTDRNGETHHVKEKSPWASALYRYCRLTSWQQAASDPSIDMAARWPDPAVRCWGLAMRDHHFAFDLDVSKEDPTITGWNLAQTMTGASYGTTGFPRTCLSITPSGGLHALYRLPEGIQLTDVVHPTVPGLSVPVPIDIRAGRKGYIIAPGSETIHGLYQALDYPPDGAIPMISAELLRLLDMLGATATGAESRSPARRATIPYRLPGHGTPNMTPIPEGSRNDTLNRWCFGRHLNHPSECPRIDEDTMARGLASGLGQAEITGIIKSVHKGILKKGAAS